LNIKNKNILITGARGFTGRALSAHLQKLGYKLFLTSRHHSNNNNHHKYITTGNLNENTDWSQWLNGKDVVIHLAARAHILKDSSKDALNEYREANTYLTLKLGRDAISQKIKRFIFVSSIGVNGAETFGSPYRSSDKPSPHSPYAISKYEAEVGLKKLFKNTESELIIIRPPLIYGKQAPGNLGLLKKFLDRNFPIPLGGLSNKKSFISIENFVDVVEKSINNNKVANKTILVSDGVDLSTSDLLKVIGILSNQNVILYKFYPPLIKLFLNIFSKPRTAQSLFGDLQIDIKETKELLDWKPVFDPSEFL